MFLKMLFHCYQYLCHLFLFAMALLTFGEVL